VGLAAEAREVEKITLAPPAQQPEDKCAITRSQHDFTPAGGDGNLQAQGDKLCRGCMTHGAYGLAGQSLRNGVLQRSRERPLPVVGEHWGIKQVSRWHTRCADPLRVSPKDSQFQLLAKILHINRDQARPPGLDGLSSLDTLAG
jgi:hypothetical protein